MEVRKRRQAGAHSKRFAPLDSGVVPVHYYDPTWPQAARIILAAAAWRSVWSAWSLLPLSHGMAVRKRRQAGAHSKRFAPLDSGLVPVYPMSLQAPGAGSEGVRHVVAQLGITVLA